MSRFTLQMHYWSLLLIVTGVSSETIVPYASVRGMTFARFLSSKLKQYRMVKNDHIYCA